MRFDTKALLKLMKQSWRGGGVKIQRTEHRGLWDSFFITGAGWALLIPKENCPGEIAGQIVTWLADMPKIGESKWVVKGCDPQDIPEDDRTIDISRYTTGNYETGMACLPLCTATGPDPVRRRRPGRSVPSGRFCRGTGRCEPRLSGYGGRHRLLERRRHSRPVLAL